MYIVSPKDPLEFGLFYPIIAGLLPSSMPHKWSKFNISKLNIFPHLTSVVALFQTNKGYCFNY